MNVRLMNMPCTSLGEMAEVTDKIFTPAAAETIPLPPILGILERDGPPSLARNPEIFRSTTRSIHRRIRDRRNCGIPLE